MLAFYLLLSPLSALLFAGIISLLQPQELSQGADHD
jgi:hypothetical protein